MSTLCAGADFEEPIRAETPEPEDRRFQDDDGTWYIWDALLRKFVDEVIQAALSYLGLVESVP